MKSTTTLKPGLAALLLGVALLASPAMMNAQSAQDTASTQTQNTGRDTDHGFNWGWLGLIGLAGLTGLRRRETMPSGRLATDTR